MSQHADCETLKSLIPAYSVGATDADETALVERLLPDCPEAAAELDQYRALSQAMVYTAPTAQPPAYLHDKLMAAVRAEQTTTIARPAPVPPIPLAVPAPRVRRYNRVFIGIAAALLLISNVYWITQVNSLQRQQQDLIALMRDQQNALASLGTGQAQRIELVSTSGSDDGVLATVLWSSAERHGAALHRPFAAAFAGQGLSTVADSGIDSRERGRVSGERGRTRFADLPHRSARERFLCGRHFYRAEHG